MHSVHFALMHWCILDLVYKYKGLLADEEKGESKEFFPFSSFSLEASKRNEYIFSHFYQYNENEEKGESKGIFLFSHLLSKMRRRGIYSLGGGSLEAN